MESRRSCNLSFTSEPFASLDCYESEFLCIRGTVYSTLAR